MAVTMDLIALDNAIDVTIPVPGDKSLTHRGILFSLLARGDMEISGWLDAGDTRSSLNVVQALGVQLIEEHPDRLVLRGTGHPEEPLVPLDCGNSGTTMRLTSGLALAVPGLVVLTGDSSLAERPMARVIQPLRKLGVSILARSQSRAPLAIQGGNHSGGQFALSVASAQVKSALLLAGITANEPVTVREPALSRDHTERLLTAMGARLKTDSKTGVTVEPGGLHGLTLKVPGDPSAAGFWGALAALAPHRSVNIPSMLFNSTRTGFFRVMERMGVGLTWILKGESPEPWGSVRVFGQTLSPVTLTEEDVPAMVDEVPLLALLATQAPGTSVIRGARELRVKESDRIWVTATILRAMGATVDVHEDGWTIYGPTRLHGASVDARGDHRMAMLAAVAATIAEGHTILEGGQSVAISYPQFFSQYRALCQPPRPEGRSL